MLTDVFFFKLLLRTFGVDQKLRPCHARPVSKTAWKFSYLTGGHFGGKLQHVGDVNEQKSSVDLSEVEK